MALSVASHSDGLRAHTELNTCELLVISIGPDVQCAMHYEPAVMDSTTCYTISTSFNQTNDEGVQNSNK